MHHTITTFGDFTFEIVHNTEGWACNVAFQGEKAHHLSVEGRESKEVALIEASFNACSWLTLWDND